MSAPVLDKQVVLLTGPATGLGRALARAFHEAGSTLALIDYNAAGMAETVASLGAGAERHTSHVADLSSRAETDAAIAAIKAAHGTVHTLIHNAGYLVPEPFSGMSERAWELTFNTGLPAAYWLTRAFWADWERDGAAIIYLSSRAGIEGGAGHAPYVATKHAIEGLTKVLGEEGKPHDILVHSLTPGMYMHTPMSERNYTPELKQKWVDPILLTPGILRLAKRQEPELSGKRLSAWELSEEVRAGKGAK